LGAAELPGEGGPKEVGEPVLPLEVTLFAVLAPPPPIITVYEEGAVIDPLGIHTDPPPPPPPPCRAPPDPPPPTKNISAVLPRLPRALTVKVPDDAKTCAL
jgi:hypothetical protein